MTVSPKVLDENSTINYLKLASGEWNESLIRDSFVAEEADAIISLPPSSSNSKDRLMWHYHSSGVYSMRSGYWPSSSSFGNPSCAGLSCSESWWKFFWHLDLPPKIKLFMWKACHNWIPARCNLMAHGMDLEVTCLICGKSAEPSLHALWHCSSLKVLQNACVFAAGDSSLDCAPFGEFVRSCSFKMKVTDFERLCVIWWRVWHRSNMAVHNNILLPVSDICAWVDNFCSDFQDANVSGLGVVARDSSGQVLISLCRNVKANYQPQIAEALAIIEGLRLAIDRGFSNFVPRLSNKVAHGLAKLDLINDDVSVWVDDCPLYVEDLIVGEVPLSL
ncbi:hypothetical protein EZV62_001405 [Acer yangbiense]|uniref:Reverse transcriptase zinc-binding domain-containing protein n=1 Tax=Acer yangbiense TaxID=1000413 RepID=A0A5C7IWD5_9ROSI|nr:hypothetical protein EZV62_001405 [Acer yangbiense]